ncbi:TspO/MBR family protein [Microbacterium thalli]|uniref:Tryptophan-rich sensory protein n=1 Tax=Microbacterium thalli TaxID=3027921 RepID=A0ABT5SK25_9MICO|nr:TspO/MBR family protein [Microbacterium thalli]MDD7927968.1 tryptophan-rich sensory protein [Microbacterium thalli]MDD7963188.1 tryptophan-rich sensory protein [Microbacterium thalli]MDN8548113.1 TspO/MBR family protein [Microbacterium thalli]
MSTTAHHAARTPGRGSDLARQITVISAVVFMIIAAMVGTGLLGGTNVREVQGGALDADSTVLAPGSQAFSIWSVIYLFMIGYAIWQALPSQRARDRQRMAGWWIALTAVLNGGWLLAAQFTTLLVTVIAIVALLAALGWTFRLLVRSRPRSIGDRLLMDATVGLHLGWVSLATVANVTAWLSRTVPESWGAQADIWGVVVLALVAAVGVGIAAFSRGRPSPIIAMSWGLAWVAIARTTDEPQSTPVAVAAVVVIVIVVAAAIVSAWRANGREHRGILHRTRTA